MKQTLKPSILSALVLAFSSFGDAFLYTALPVNALQMNVPVAWVGFLLSINRFVRLTANQLFVYLFNLYGFKRITILAAVFATLTTLFYGIATGIIVWIIARIIWGFCFSALRISSISYSLENKQQGFSLGISKGLQELGPIIALLVGPFLLQWTSPATTFLIFALTSVSAVIISFYLPELKPVPVNFTFSFNFIPSSFDFLTFLSAFFVQGILIVTISKLLISPTISAITLTAIAGIYLAYRRICSVIISPFGGILADKFGLDRVFIMFFLFTVIGLFLIAIGYTRLGIIAAFTSNSLTAALAPGCAAGTSDQLKAVAINGTWSDIGSALGVLVMGAFLNQTHLSYIFFIATFIMLIACGFHVKTSNLQTREFLKWK